MKYLKLVIPMVFFLAISSYAEKHESRKNYPTNLFSINITGGTNFVFFSDYNASINTYNKNINENRLLEGSDRSYKKLNWGMNFFGEIVLHINPTLGIGVGAGYQRIKKQENFIRSSGWWGADIRKSTKNVELRSIPLSINMHFYINIAPRVKLDLHIGPTATYSSFNIDSYLSDTFLSQIRQTNYKANKLHYGVRSGLGVDYEISNMISIFVNGIFKYSPLRDLCGSLHKYSDSSLHFYGPFDYTIDDCFVWVKKESSGTYLNFGDGNWGEYFDWEKATIIGSELICLMGIKLRL